MPDQTIQLKLVIDPSGAISAVQMVGGETVKQSQRAQKETSALTGFIKDQRAENRQQNFLLREGAQSVGALSLAVTAFGGAASGQMKHVTDGISRGIVAFQGFDFALAGASKFLPALGGPWGIAIAVTLALGTAFLSSSKDSEPLKKDLEELLDLQVELGEVSLQNKLNKQKEDLAKAEEKLKDLNTTMQFNLGVQDEWGNAQGNATQRTKGSTAEITAQEKAVGELQKKIVATTDAIEAIKPIPVEDWEVWAEDSDKALTKQIALLKEEQESVPRLGRRYAEIGIEIDVLTRKLNDAKQASDAFVGTKLPVTREEFTAPVMPTAAGSITAIEKKIEADKKRLRETGLQAERDALQERIKMNEEAVQTMMGQETLAQQNKMALISSTLGQMAQTFGQYTAVGKAVAIFQATINTYEAITKALTAGPILGPIMAGIIGAMGFANVAQIASAEPPSFAQGGLVFGPTLALVGDNPNASNDPELISPLSKLQEIIHRTVTVQPARAEGGYDFNRLETQISGLRRDLRRKKMGIAIDQVIEGTTIVERNFETAQRRVARRKLG